VLFSEPFGNQLQHISDSIPRIYSTPRLDRDFCAHHIRGPYTHIPSAGSHIDPQIPRQWNLRNTTQGRDRRRRRFRCLALRRPAHHRPIRHRCGPAGAIRPPKPSRSARNVAVTLPAANSHCTRRHRCCYLALNKPLAFNRDLGGSIIVLLERS